MLLRNDGAPIGVDWRLRTVQTTLSNRHMELVNAYAEGSENEKAPQDLR